LLLLGFCNEPLRHHKGRPPSIDTARVLQLKAEGWGASQIARKLGIGRASVYRALESH